MFDVLVVDDELTVCRTLARLFRCEGHDAACATAGADALRLLAGAGAGGGPQSSRPKLIVLDVMMPGMNGLEVLALIRADPATASLAVIMYSAVDDPQVREHAARLGAQEFVAKSGGFLPLYSQAQQYLV